MSKTAVSRQEMRTHATTAATLTRFIVDRRRDRIITFGWWPTLHPMTSALDSIMRGIARDVEALGWPTKDNIDGVQYAAKSSAYNYVPVAVTMCPPSGAEVRLHAINEARRIVCEAQVKAKLIGRPFILDDMRIVANIARVRIAASGKVSEQIDRYINQLPEEVTNAISHYRKHHRWRSCACADQAGDEACSLCRQLGRR